MKTINKSISISNNCIVQLDFVADLLTIDAPKVGKYEFAQLSPTETIPFGTIKPINYLLSTKNKANHWFHCFVDDRQFERLWNNPSKYDKHLCQVAGLISTDFSLYRDMSEEVTVWNCRRNRAYAYHLQQLGIPMIPTAGFGAEYTWDWCFDGLPSNSVLAITTNGVLSDLEAKRLFIGGVDNLVIKKQPKALVVCGNYPDWLNHKYPNIRIVRIPNFSQMQKGMR